MQKPKSIIVTDQEIDLSPISPRAWEYIENLGQAIAARYTSLGKSRAVFALAGPAGVGKSVLSALLAQLFAQSNNHFQFINVGIDAYHFPQETLFRWGLDDHKGRYDTYDIENLRADLVAFKNGDRVNFPRYSRKLHNPVPQCLPTASDSALLWLEGQWLLYKEGEWAELMSLYDYTYFINTSEAAIAAHVIARHVTGGKSRERAQSFYTNSDEPNIKLVLEKSLPANENLPFWETL